VRKYHALCGDEKEDDLIKFEERSKTREREREREEQ
jgi:hypothetical protein